MEISVIIPVYNASKYIKKAVESALQLHQVKEVILIEDGSPDNSYEVCNVLSNKYNSVRLFQHEGGVNMGAAASRNLGIEKSNYNYIAFLDADDFYLPNRFKFDEEIFASNSDTDGVYNALGFHYYSEDAKKKYDRLGMSDLTTISSKVPSSEVLNVLLGNTENITGYFSCVALTVKKSVFDKVGMFNEELRMYEDTDFIFRLSVHCNLEGGSLDSAVAMRGVHDDNRISKKVTNYYNHIKLYKGLYDWSKSENISEEAVKTFKYYYLSYKTFHTDYVNRLLIFIHVILNKYNLKRGLFTNIVHNSFKNDKMRYLIFGFRNRLL